MGAASTTFAVGSQRLCLWGRRLPADNLRFLQQVDAGFFIYQAETHRSNLGGANRQHAAIALRAAFHHGLETLFSLLGAAVQAPQCVAAWILRCDTARLEEFIGAVEKGGYLPNELDLTELSWNGIATKLLEAQFVNAPHHAELRAGFGRLWSRLANEYLDPLNAEEYKSLRHGFRVRSGGTTVMVAPAAAGPHPGKADFVPVGETSNEFGSGFYRAIPINGAPPCRPDLHLQLDLYGLNWSPTAMADALDLIAISIHNICGALRHRLGEALETLPAPIAPEDSTAFERPWQNGPSLRTVHRQENIAEADIRRWSGRQLRQMLRQRHDEGKKMPSGG